jgi:Uma2 family endonuclease
MSIRLPSAITPEEYLAAERDAETKSEYSNGQVFAMAGASPDHNRLAFDAGVLLSTQLETRPCEVFGSDLRVKVEATGLYTYPDVSVVCGEPQFEEIAQVQTLVNPTVLIKVLSPSTAQYDRGTKWLHYRALPSLRDYVLISQDEYRVEHYTRQPDGRWLFAEARGLTETIDLPTIGCRLSLDRLYARVRIPPTPQPA